jgi:hypothetical protein
MREWICDAQAEWWKKCQGVRCTASHRDAAAALSRIDLMLKKSIDGSQCFGTGRVWTIFGV